jgi:hypothetical protein
MSTNFKADLKEGEEKESDSVQVGSMMAGKGKNITLRTRAEVDGEEVLNEEGDSLTWGFVQFLLAQMRGFDAKAPQIYTASEGGQQDHVFVTGTDNSNSNFRFEWKTRGAINGGESYDYWSHSGTSQDFIYLPGHPEIDNRPFYITNHSNFEADSGWIEVNEAEFDPSSMSWVDTGTPFEPNDPSTFSLRGGEKANRIWSTKIDNYRAYYNNLDNVYLLLGSGTQMMSLSNVGAIQYNYSGFSYDTHGRPAPIINTNDAHLKWSRTVTNDTGSDINIREVFLRENNILIAKDKISAVTIPTGSSATFYYQIEVDNSAGGGVMSQFLELMHRHANKADRECPDIFNNNRTRRRSYWTFRLTAGKPGQPVTPSGGYRAVCENIGLMVGTGTGSVANTNFALDNRIPHGNSAGELHHYGMFITGYTVDESNGRLFFEAERVFENRTSSSITINEAGLYAGGAAYVDSRENAAITASDYYGRRFADQHLITRTVLDTSITIDPGKLKKLYYEVGIKI